jgi:thiopurine S-methyltransferase
LSQWEKGNTGWHQENGNTALRKFWPQLAPGSRVLVPLCGKSTDLLWLAKQDYAVTGVELSEIAVRAFFDEADIQFEISEQGELKWFRNLEYHLTIVCGDYFQFLDKPYDALYDRASLVALARQKRPTYIQHTNNLLKPGAAKLLLTLEYDQSRVAGPPFSILADEVKSYWPGLRRVGDRSACTNIPAKFRDAGMSEMVEAVWVSAKKRRHASSATPE